MGTRNYEMSGGDESSYQEFTSKWLNLHNRGKIYDVNDEVYVFFVELELQFHQTFLNSKLTKLIHFHIS